LQTISVDFGSVVRKGQVIAQLEPQEYKLRVQQAEAGLAQARARLGLNPDGARSRRDRAAKLVEQGVVSRAELDTAESEYKVALSRYQDGLEEIRNRQGLLAQRRTELAMAKQQLADTAVYSPLDGVVQEKKASAGEYLAAGAPLVDVVRIDPLRLRVDVPERESHNIRWGRVC